ncbi:ubiquitin interaction domain-containing protein [Hirsutella rhossiliensis]|uniref:Ubiquitin interaction domain-containing protein n=1 Tax=Hirsutella rhossiliensis TaxID=111463 RepID=A0A9P8SKY1_9HYPO|nr:ubiquitin interaction domain-containing protein [Hirsutella rhossiliensis]KAH0965255.1 ubiquitin interaction domain-containing protein [Hirsutella rhossiliensis]
MASKEPSEDQISQVIDFASLDPHDDRSLVIQALKDNSGNVESVVMQYFDNPASFRQKFTRAWNDSMFSADRDGSDNHTGISFHIESMGPNDVIQGVTPPPEGCGPGAPSRPPSRSNNRSPLGRMVDWTAGADVSGASNTQSREDQDMQRALRESAQEAGIPLPQQESGVLDSATSVPSFGPANRSDYDQDSWAVVPSESKIATAPAPETRKRAPGAPAFLVSGLSSAGEHCLGGLLTILHGIPLSRNILLGTGKPAESYGFNSEWWKGQEILPPHVLNRLQSGAIAWGERHGAAPSSEEEIHRLMAFLDSTERSYGAVSVLTDLIPFSSVGPEKRLFEHLVQRRGELMMPLTQVATLTHVLGDDEGEEEARFGLLEVEHVRTDYANIKTLYESLDHIMWSDVLSWSEMHEGSKMAMFKDMGDVMVIKISGDGPEDAIDIPEELYPEKYLLTRKDEARRIQKGWCETKQAIQRIAQGEQELYEWRNDWNHQSFDKRGMILKVIGQWKTYREYLAGRGRFRGMEESGFDTDKYPDYRTAPCQMDDEEKQHHQAVEDVLQMAERALADIEEKLKALNQDLEQIRARQRFLGRLLTVPDKPGRPQPMTCKKFLLSGIATPTDIVYLRQRSEPELMEMESRPKPHDQWWRLAYAPKEEQPVKAEKIELERVLREIWQETKNPLLVYATDEALNTPRAPLSASLERFVRAENKAFRQELSRESNEAADGRPVGMMEVMSPSKRKHRADSADSMDSTKQAASTEMTDLSEHQRAGAFGSGRTAAASEESDVPGPPLPERKPVEADGATENKVAAGGQSPKAAADDRDDKSDRGPEMQERARPPSFMAVPQGKAPHEGAAPGIDMELPDYQE